MAILSSLVIAVIVIVVVLVVAAIVIPIAIIYSLPKHKATSIFEYSTIEGSGNLTGEHIPAYYESLGIFDLWNAGYQGENIKILIIDSGVNIFHPDLDNVQLANVNVIEDDHGTAVAGIFAGQVNQEAMVGIAPNAIVYSWDFGDGSISSVVSAIGWAITNGIDVINCSFGTTSNVPALQSIIQSARTAGIFIIASSGNTGSSDLDYPARYSQCIPVASVDPNGDLSYFSSYNSSNPNMVVAYGEYIVTDNAAFTSDSTLLVAATGTSFSCPFVTGLCAILLQKALDEGSPRPSLSQMVTLLKQHLPANPS